MAGTIVDLPSSFLDESDVSFRPSSSLPGPVSSSQDTEATAGAPVPGCADTLVSRSEVMRLQLDANPALAQEFLETLTVERKGYCF